VVPVKHSTLYVCPRHCDVGAEVLEVFIFVSNSLGPNILVKLLVIFIPEPVLECVHKVNVDKSNAVGLYPKITYSFA